MTKRTRKPFKTEPQRQYENALISQVVHLEYELAQIRQEYLELQKSYQNLLNILRKGE